MARVKASLTLIGFNELKDRLDPKKFNRRIRKHVGRATLRNALVGMSRAKRDIQSGKFTPNAPTTVALKGSSKPLVDTGELFKSITGEAVAWNVALIGVLKNRAVRNKETGKVEDLIMVAKILHDGAVVPVTAAMRRLFFRLARTKPGVVPLSSRTRVLVIRPRPFLQGVLDRSEIRKYKANWSAAVRRALAGVN